VPDFTTYQPPGVYIEEDLSSLVNVIGIRPTVVALIGPSVGYRRNTEARILTGDAQQLARKGINPASISVKGVDGTTYIVTTDYTVTVEAGADGNIGATADNLTSLTRVGAGGLPEGTIVYVTYEFTDADYYSPLRVRDFDDVQEAYGPPIDIESGTVVSPLSFAAKAAFENGANQVVLVSTTGALGAPVTRVQLTAAYAKLATLYDVNVVVPLPIGITGNVVEPGDTYTVGTDLRSHLETMAADGLFRVGIIGYEKDVTIDPLTAVANFKSPRMVLAWPNRLHYYHGYTSQTLEVGGYYLAAAYAGRLAALPVQMPLTKKQISGFSGFPSSMLQQMTVSKKNEWSDGGVAVTELTRDGRLVVRHGTTTMRTNIQTRELSLVRAKDALVTLLQETMDSSDLIGGFIDEDTPNRVKGVVAGVLEAAKTNKVIIDYTGLKIRQLPGDPSVMEVKFQYLPAYPLNYIVISFSINTSTGETTVLDLAA
jgi:hypothetical protein